MPGDRGARRTLPLATGGKRALLWCTFPLALLALLSPVPFLIGMYNVAYLVIVIIGVDLLLAVALVLCYARPDRARLGMFASTSQRPDGGRHGRDAGRERVLDMGSAAAILLGLVQGLTEFLPVSSSGHLVLAQAILGIRSEGILMEVLLHVATALVVLGFYREKAIDLLRPRFDDERNRYRLAIIVGLLPTAFVGLFLKDRIEELFERPGPTLAALAFTGIFLLLTRLAPPRERRITLGIALIIGLAQAVAIMPGISRSGATIACALFLGVRRREGAEFSFLLSVPAILGAALLDGEGSLRGGRLRRDPRTGPSRGSRSRRFGLLGAPPPRPPRHPGRIPPVRLLLPRPGSRRRPHGSSSFPVDRKPGLDGTL